MYESAGPEGWDTCAGGVGCWITSCADAIVESCEWPVSTSLQLDLLSSSGGQECDDEAAI